ncbi:BppU family phage baseplate upper protein [Clostridium perfringens]|uniref:BppU family phage baseplate upper protein n=1 Tax=Clostridium perfringens TaxID=1502 RepID=UPI002B21712E|nr:BppU family phage baseplate upper protein [Clostridium perfringens]MEA5268725.1 BppU family phage baseplate upper protein [Clostridium perfringens]MEA5380352.1 BppU family phage baseplate upper protein [Clostridium perfringens]
MAKKNLKVKVDTINGLYKPEGTIKQLDSVFFNIEVTEEGEKKDLTGQTIKLFARKSDGKMVEQSSGISITNAEQGKLTIDLLNAAVQAPGYVYFELEISDSNGIISTADFVYKVMPKVGSDEAIESTNEVSTLKEIEVYVAQAKQEIKEFKALQIEMLKTNKTINSNEILREDAEKQRVETEKIRNQKLTLFDNRVTDVENDLYCISSNLFDFSKLIIGKIPELRIGATKDDFSSLSNWRTTNYIPVTANEQYCVIRNKAITQQQFTVVYFKDGINIGYDNPASNPFTIKEGADHIYICTGNSDLFIEDKTSVKKHEVDIDLSFKPFGKERQFALKDTVKETGVYIENSNYHHFVRFRDNYLIRSFKREGPNKLFQFSSLGIGNITKKGVVITKKIADNGTDIIGPISIMRQGVDSGGMWAGGYHDVGVNGSRFPTAQQESLKVTVNGIDITNSEGLHYGTINITTKNKIYFPKTVTGIDLNEATQALLETRNYTLDNKMNVNVKLDFLQDTRVICYYGLQAVRIGFDNIILPDDEKNIVFNEMNGDYWIEKPNRKVIMGSKDFNYELILKEYGLGNFNHNSGVSSYKFGSLPQNTRKFYQVLIAGDYNHTFIKKGTSLYWEGIYNIYPN